MLPGGATCEQQTEQRGGKNDNRLELSEKIHKRLTKETVSEHNVQKLFYRNPPRNTMNRIRNVLRKSFSIAQQTALNEAADQVTAFFPICAAAAENLPVDRKAAVELEVKKSSQPAPR